LLPPHFFSSASPISCISTSAVHTTQWCFKNLPSLYFFLLAFSSLIFKFTNLFFSWIHPSTYFFYCDFFHMKHYNNHIWYLVLFISDFPFILLTSLLINYTFQAGLFSKNLGLSVPIFLFQVGI
jgi:hypothetical protein